MPQTGNFIFSLVSSAATYQMYRNGTGAGATAADYAAGNVHQIGLSTFARLLGDIAELVICNAALSEGKRQAAEVICNEYWGIY